METVSFYIERFGYYIARYFVTYNFLLKIYADPDSFAYAQSVFEKLHIFAFQHLIFIGREFRSLQLQYPDWRFCFVVLTKSAQSGFESRTKALPELFPPTNKKGTSVPFFVFAERARFELAGPFKGSTSLAKRYIRPL